MNKPLIVISCPIDCYAGYAARSRDFVKALYELKKEEYEIKIIPQRWGSCPYGYVEDHFEEWGWLNDLLLLNPQLPKQPDVWVQITVPNEFQPIGKYNIGVTAGIETTICDPSWIEGCNRMNLTLVSSKHAKTVFENSKFEKKDQMGNTIEHIFLNKPVEVLFEGVDLNTYFYLENENLDSTDLVCDIDDLNENFIFLYVGHWIQGDLGEDRKNTGLLIKLFFEAFKDRKKQPALLLKTSSAGASIMDRDTILEKIDKIRSTVKSKNLPNVYLLHGEFSDADMNNLYNHPSVKAMISLTKGEGYGRPLAEFCLSKKPVIATAWSGHTDFLSPDSSILLPGHITQVHPSAHVPNMILNEAGWFSPDMAAASRAMIDVFENYSKYEVKGKKQGHKIKTEFNYDNMVLLLKSYLDKYVPAPVVLKLPTLKKIELPQLKKVE